jgi:hypothetical protein
MPRDDDAFFGRMSLEDFVPSTFQEYLRDLLG